MNVDGENNGLVKLQGGMAKTKTYFVSLDWYERRCVHCNQREGEQYNDECYGTNAKLIPGPEPKHAFNIATPMVRPPHEFDLLPPFKIQVPLDFRNRSYASYSYTKQRAKNGLWVYTYDGERGERCLPSEL